MQLDRHYVDIIQWLRDISLFVGFGLRGYREEISLSSVDELLEFRYRKGQAGSISAIITIQNERDDRRLIDVNLQLQRDLVHKLGRYRSARSELLQEASELLTIVTMFFPNIQIKNELVACSCCQVLDLCTKIEDRDIAGWICSTCKKKALTISNNTKSREVSLVYVFGNRELGYAKIGYSKSPKTRMSAYATYLPFEISLMYVIPTDDKRKAEWILHSRFKDKRLEREWFMLSKKDLDWLGCLDRFENGDFRKRETGRHT